MKFTVKDLENAVRELAIQNPTATYYNSTGVCLYTYGSSGQGTGCLIGQAILKLDDKLYNFLRKEDYFSPMSINGILKKLNLEGSIWLSHIQKLQDIGDTWARCIEKTDEVCDSVP
jgi:hypothetical protein